MKHFYATNSSSLIHEEMYNQVLVNGYSSKINGNDVTLIYDGVENDRIKTIKSLGINVIFHRLTYLDELLNTKHHCDVGKQITSGAFLRTEVCLLTDEPYVLYTDCDVLFNNPCNDLEKLQPISIAAAPEMNPNERTHFNTGTLVLNTKFLKETYQDFKNYILQNNHRSPDHDQQHYNEFYRSNRIWMDCEYNWKPYWGRNDNAKIVHFHGVKYNGIPEMAAGKYIPGRSELFRMSPTGAMHYYQLFMNILAQAKKEIK